MTKIKIEWTIEVTETYTAELDLEDLADYIDGDVPSLDEIRSGGLDKIDIDAEALAGLEEDDARKYVSVDERYVDSIWLIKDS